MKRFGWLVAVALAASGCSGLDSAPDAGSMPIDEIHYRWLAGDCLDVEGRSDLPHEPFGGGLVVDCETEHSYEVILADELADGPDAAYPDDLGTENWDACAAAFRDYLGAHVSETRLDLVAYQPDRTEWAGGFRYRTCLVEEPGAGNDPVRRTGSLRDAAPDYPATVAAGQCFDGRDLRGAILDCSGPHLAEAIGSFTHPEDEGAAWPGLTEARLAAERGCAAILEGYASAGESPVEALPIAFARPLSRVEWEGGLRTVACGVLVFDGDRHHVPVIGSLADPDWSVVRAGQVA